jgi:nitrite reductase/ring-hydroxylating ferredoxin subunit
MVARTQDLVCAASLNEVRQTGCLTVQLEAHTLVLFAYGDQVYAVDNRCPHMGFPLDRGTVQDGILVCHWHHARFDLAGGGTFDQFADDVRAFPTEIRNGEVWVDLSPQADPLEHQRQRLQDGLERNISLVSAKAVISLLEGGVDPAEPFRIGLEFGTRYRQEGWGQGLTIHTCMMNILPYLAPEDRPRAMYHGLSSVANNTEGAPPRFMIHPLPNVEATDVATLKRWFRQFIEVRDAESAERCIVSAVRAGADDREMADMLFAAATDHRYLTIGHPLDFTNKAFEALDVVGWDYAELALTSLVNAYAGADRMEESSQWRTPIDLIEILDAAFEELPALVQAGRIRRESWAEDKALVGILLSDDPKAIADALLDAISQGCTAEKLAGYVTYAAALRIAQFHTSNEFGDWDTALHTFTFANAVQQGLRRIGSPVGDDPYIPLLRGVFDAAMSVYLDRFLNIPAARIPQPNGRAASTDALLGELTTLLDRQQQVNEAGAQVAQYLYSGGDPDQLMAMLGRLLMREDRDFHTIQTIEAAFRQYSQLRGTPEATNVLIASARYLAAHAPTMRAQGQTFTIAQRLQRGEHLFEE